MPLTHQIMDSQTNLFLTTPRQIFLYIPIQTCFEKNGRIHAALNKRIIVDRRRDGRDAWSRIHAALNKCVTMDNNKRRDGHDACSRIHAAQCMM